MGTVGLFILLFAPFLIQSSKSLEQCKFTSTDGFYAHVPADLPIGDVVFRGTVMPEDAEMVIANVRSDVLKDTDWSDRVVIDRPSTPGSYLVRLGASLSLPVYPSTLKEANLFVTVICNGYAYPLFTVHIDNTNRFAPQFYNEPYLVAIDKNVPVWNVIDTPVAAIDWDPAESYNLKFWLEDSHKGFELVDERTPSNSLIAGSSNWPENQLPSVIRLRVTGQYELPMSLRLIVSDGAKMNPRKSTTFINLVEKTRDGGSGGRITVGMPSAVPSTVRTTVASTTVKTTVIPSTTTTVPSTTTVASTSTVPPTTEAPTTVTTTVIPSTTTVTAPSTVPSSTTTTVASTTTTVSSKSLVSELSETFEVAETTKTTEEDSETSESSTTTVSPKSLKSEISELSEVPQAEKEEEDTDAPEVPETSQTSTIPVNPKVSKVPKTSNPPEILIDSDVTKTPSADRQLIQKLKKTLESLTLKKIEEDEDQLDAIAFAAKNREMNAIETENLDDIQADPPTRFTQCSLRTSIPENSKKGTKVAKLEMLNRRNTTKIRLIDPDNTFSISADEVEVNDPKLVDRELFSTLELVAEIEDADPTVQCSRIRIYIDLEDENDNRPVFENENYFFHVSQNIPPGKEIGKLVAQDIDQGPNGHITYHLLTPDVPFQVGTQGKKGILMTTGKLSEDVYVYNLTVEARDHGEDVVKSARVPVEVFVLGAKPRTTSSAPPKIEGVKTSVASGDSEDSEDVEVVTEIVEVVEEPAEDGENSEDVEVVTEIVEVMVDEDGEEEQKTSTPEDSGNSEELTTFKTTSEDVASNDVKETEEDFTTPPPIPDVFSFRQPEYTYDAFGMEIKENDLLGKVQAFPNPEFYAVDREVAGIIKINEVGEILAGKNLNKHSDGPIKFGISATNGFETARAQVTVLRDANRDVMSAVPRFDQDTYRFNIMENQQPEVVGIVRAFHSALSSSESVRLTYSLIAPAHIDELPFEIHEQSGEVSTSRPLDAEQQKFYRFQVRACLTQTICSTSDIIVEVLDANDNSPVMVNRKLEATVESDVPPGTRIVKVYAKDADSGNNSRITFSIKPDTSVFSIDPTTGQIITAQSLTQPLYTLLIDASDNGIPRRSDTAEVTVVVKGTNPSPPAFDQKEYNVQIPSPIRAGQVIGEVHATDPDPGVEGTVTYRLLRADNEDHHKFSINSKTGVISAMSQLSIQDGPVQLVIEASDNGKNSKRSAKTTLKIDIVDSQTLKFLPLPMTVYISTEKAVGSVILRVSATSADNENIKFRALQDNSQFVMDGDLLRVANHLVEGESTLSIRAETDTMHVDHQLKVIVMADRDKYPVFPQLTYDFDVSTDGHFPRVVHQFNAKLTSGNIRYTFFPPTPPQGFYLDEKSGELFVTSQFPAKPHETVFVVIRAVNLAANKFYSDVGVAISPISSTNPTMRFQQSTYNFEVYENLEKGEAVGTISITGATPSDVKFSMSPDNSFLGIHPNGTIFLSEKVDAEELEDQLTQEFTVIAEHPSGTARARVQVAIRDVNEFQPEFDEEEVEFSVDVNAAPGLRIGRVIAHDKDVTEKNKLIYRVVGGSGRKLVFIQEDGTIIVGDEKIPSDLDSFDLIIEAVDRNGNHDSTHVVVYVDGGTSNSEDVTPLFLGQPLVWNVTEGTTQSFELKASGGSTIRFKIIGGNSDGHFDIVHLPEENTARLRIVSELGGRRQYTLQIEARDERSQQTSVGEVTVNVLDGNDHSPMFTRDEYSGTIPMDIPIGFPIVTIEATDIDRDPIQFSLQGDPCEGQFGIDNSGRVAYKVPKEKRTDGIIVCVVVASDGQHSVDTTLRLEVQPGAGPTDSPTPNQAPKFAAPEFNFNVVSSAKEIGKVEANDPEEDHIEYSIEPTEYRNLFNVDSSGQITVISKLEQPRYSFLVVAEDRGDPVMSTFTNVKVKVEDVEMETTISVTTATMTVTLEDNEVSLGTKTTVGRSGAPELTTPAPTPEFSQSVYSWRIDDGLPVGSIVGQVKMDGKDDDIEYSFISEEYLSIDSEGRVTVVKPLTETINDVVIATRGGNILAETRVFVAVARTTTVLSTTTTEAPTTTVTTTVPPTLPTEEVYSPTTTNRPQTIAPINLPVHQVTSRVIPLEITPNPPEKFSFTQPNYYAFSVEGEFKSGIELEIKPVPLGTVNSQGRRVVYSIEDTTTKMPFFLSEDGKLIMFEADRERHSSYYFTIVARAAPDMMARARMNVTVLDVNDNYPAFEKHPEVIGISRGMYIGSPIYQLHATDNDEDNIITYDISPRDYFSIDPREGLIRVFKDLRGAPDEFQVTVTASDSGKPPLKSQVKLEFKMFNGSVPTLPKDLPEMIVGTSMIPGTPIRQIVGGPTVEENDKILYRLVDSVNGLFEVKDGGVLVLSRRPLDTEANKYHQLNVTAENSQGFDWTVLPIYVEGRLSGTTSPPPPPASSCQFAQKVYRTQVKENSQPRTAVLRVQAGCQDVNRKFRYAFHQPTQDFEIDSQSGQIYTSRSLDRETKSSYLLVVNVIEQRMAKRQSEQAVQQATSKLSPWQALIVVTILDDNDNSPTFLHLLDDSTLSAVVDQNANIMTPIIHLQARDLDVFPGNLRFDVEGENADMFVVNHTNGLVQLAKSLEKESIEDHFELHATVSDGTHKSKVPLNIYPLSVDTNVVQLTKDTPHGEIDPAQLEKKLSEVLGVDTRILVAQPFVDDNGKTDSKKSHVFVYALEDSDRKPMSRDRLKSLLMAHPDGLHPMNISSVSLLSTGSTGPQTLLTVILLCVLIALILFICALVFFCAKRRNQRNPALEGSYMINSVGSGPRPYDVENISRLTAQTVLAGRPLPDPQEHRIDMSSDSDIALERDDTTREFSNSVRERPSLLQSAIQRQKVQIQPIPSNGDDLKM